MMERTNQWQTKGTSSDASTRIEIDPSAAIVVEQIDDEITVVIASVACTHFQVTAEQALRLSRALAVAAENANKCLAEDGTIPLG